MVLLNSLLGLSLGLKGKDSFSGEEITRLDSGFSDFQLLFLKEFSNLKSSKMGFLGERKKLNLLEKSVNSNSRGPYLNAEETKKKVKKSEKEDVIFDLVPVFNLKSRILGKSKIASCHSEVNNIVRIPNLISQEFFQKKHKLFPYFKGDSSEISLNQISSYEQENKGIERVFFKLRKKRKEGQVLSFVEARSILVGIPSLNALLPKEFLTSRLINNLSELKNNFKADVELKGKKSFNESSSLRNLKGKIYLFVPISIQSTQLSVKKLSKNRETSYILGKLLLDSANKSGVENVNLNNQGQDRKIDDFFNFKSKSKALLSKEKENEYIKTILPSKVKSLINKTNSKDLEKNFNSEFPLRRKVKVQLEVEPKERRAQVSELNKVNLEKRLINSKLSFKLTGGHFSKFENQVTQNESDILGSGIINNTGDSGMEVKFQHPEVKLERIPHYKENGESVLSLLAPQEQSSQNSYDLQDGFSSSNSFENRKKEFPAPVNSSFQNLVIRNEDVAMRFSFNRAGILNLSLSLSENFTLEPSLIEDIRSIIRSSGFTPGKVYLKVKSKGEAKERTTELKV